MQGRKSLRSSRISTQLIRVDWFNRDKPSSKARSDASPSPCFGWAQQSRRGQVCHPGPTMRSIGGIAPSKPVPRLNGWPTPMPSVRCSKSLQGICGWLNTPNVGQPENSQPVNEPLASSHGNSDLTRVSLMSNVKGRPIGPSLGAALIFVVTQFAISSAHPEEWYPKQCLVESNCAEVESTTYAPPAISGEDLLMVTTRHGAALVPADFLRRRSMDGKMHACMRPDEEGMRLVCLFAPGRTPARARRLSGQVISADHP